MKKWLLDETVIAGIGNIYADEACFYAGIRPDREVFAVRFGFVESEIGDEDDRVLQRVPGVIFALDSVYSVFCTIFLIAEFRTGLTWTLWFIQGYILIFWKLSRGLFDLKKLLEQVKMEWFPNGKYVFFLYSDSKKWKNYLLRLYSPISSV